MINKKYLDKKIITNKITEFNNKKPIWYIVFDNFIEHEFYNECLGEVKNNNIKILGVDEGASRLNKSIFIKWKNLYKLNNFLKWKNFEKYVSLFFKSNLEREFYVDSDDIEKLSWEYEWLLGQLYEEWDYYGWHVDWLEKWISLGTFIYYLSAYSDGDDLCPNWWELELWEGEWGNIKWYKEVQPLNNRLVLLLYSDIAFHRVNKVISDDFKRISIQATFIKK